MALTGRQRLFVDAYLKCFNATKAAKEAGYSEKAARSIGQRLLTYADIKETLRTHYEKNAMDSNELLHHLADIARGNIDDVIDDKGNLDLARARELGKSPLIRSVRSRSTLFTDKGGDGSETFETEVTMYDRMKALELIGKHLAMFTERVHVTDWRSELLQLVQSGKLTLADIQMELGDEFAQEFVIPASLPSVVGGES